MMIAFITIKSSLVPFFCWGLIQRSQEKTEGRVVVGEVDEVVGVWQSNRELGGRLKRQEKLGGRRGLGVLVSWC